ncbi:MAG: hypothetical protein LUC93_16490 [Planctomycetaceae bacterium]|nr:hypothetical protein [Planctomycetaceae bacterium]
MDTLAFSEVVIENQQHPQATGILYAKPDSGVVLAHLYCPSRHPLPGVSSCKQFLLSALCANGKPMTDVSGWVTSITRMGEQYRYHLALYRKGYDVRPVPQYLTHPAAYTRKGLRELMREHLWYHRLVRLADNSHERRLVFDRIIECGLALQRRPKTIGMGKKVVVDD